MEIKIEVAHRPNRPPGAWSGGDAGSIDRDTSRISNRDELRSLLDWLRREEPLRGRATLSQGPPGPGEMGTGTDVLTIVLGSGGTVAVLARALSIWLSHRSSDLAVRITRPDGQQVEIEAWRVRNIRAVIEDVQELFDPQASGFLDRTDDPDPGDAATQ